MVASEHRAPLRAQTAAPCVELVECICIYHARLHHALPKVAPTDRKRDAIFGNDILCELFDVDASARGVRRRRAPGKRVLNASEYDEREHDGRELPIIHVCFHGYQFLQHSISFCAAPFTASLFRARKIIPNPSQSAARRRYALPLMGTSARRRYASAKKVARKGNVKSRYSSGSFSRKRYMTPTTLPPIRTPMSAGSMSSPK